MKLLALLLALSVGLPSGPVHAQQPTAPAPTPAVNSQAELKVAADRLAAQRAVVEKQRLERIASAKSIYTATLDRLQKDLMAKGDLDAVLAVKGEAKRMERELTPEERRALPEGLRTARAIYEKMLAQIADLATTGEIAALTNHSTDLELVQKRLTQAGDIDDAQKVKLERAQVADQIANLQRNLTPPPAAPEPPKPAVAVAPPKPSLIPPSTLSGPPVAMRDIAEEVRTKSGTKGAAAGVISFNGPNGNGRSGAKGILLKNDPQTGTNGTTWSFTYVRDGTAYGLQIIHPHGRGQVIVNLNKEGVNVSLPDSWADIGWGAGQSKPAVRMTKDGEALFPLTDGTEYQVESKVTATGSVEVLINGRLAATGRATGASPLLLEIPDGKKVPLGGRGKSEFTGTDLPMKWEPGFAGLILGPMDKGQNACRLVRFQASASPGR